MSDQDLKTALKWALAQMEVYGGGGKSSTWCKYCGDVDGAHRTSCKYIKALRLSEGKK
jgi:hypothetical protein